MYFKHRGVLDKKLTGENYKKALKMLEGNVLRLECYGKDVLTTGKGYPGIWLEHNHDSLFYADISPEIAKNSHRIFYDFQSDDGLFPAYICKWPHEEAYRIGYGHVQSVYPISASAYEIAVKTGDEEFLSDSYRACVKYDRWLEKYRNTKGTGLVEMFCGFDTGQDNSARIFGIENVCPQGNARICPDDEILPVTAPDLSAMKYRFKVALGNMAEALGNFSESEKWRKDALFIKEKLYEVCYDKDDCFFYDVDSKGNFRKYIGEHIFRLFLNHAVEKEVFEIIFEKYIMNENHFNCAYPFSSISVSAPYFNIDLAENNWNGKTQMHTALETLFWMEYYGKKDVLYEYMEMMVDLCNKSNMICSQELNPFDGTFSAKAPLFTTTLIMYVEFVKRLGLDN